MNIKEWKQFSDAVDEFNKKNRDYFSNEHFSSPGGGGGGGGSLYEVVKKTEVNFWEWSIGKLKL